MKFSNLNIIYFQVKNNGNTFTPTSTYSTINSTEVINTTSTVAYNQTDFLNTTQNYTYFYNTTHPTINFTNFTTTDATSKPIVSKMFTLTSLLVLVKSNNSNTARIDSNLLLKFSNVTDKVNFI
jgi:hypothetical protein